MPRTGTEAVKLDKLEALDTALDITRSRANASKDLLTAMLQEKLSVAQLREIKGAKTIGGRLRLLREMRNLDQRELSDMSGVSQTTISNLENDRVSEPSFASLDALTTSLGVPAGAVYPFIKGVQS